MLIPDNYFKNQAERLSNLINYIKKVEDYLFKDVDLNVLTENQIISRYTLAKDTLIKEINEILFILKESNLYNLEPEVKIILEAILGLSDYERKLLKEKLLEIKGEISEDKEMEG